MKTPDGDEDGVGGWWRQWQQQLLSQIPHGYKLHWGSMGPMGSSETQKQHFCNDKGLTKTVI